LFEAIGVTMQLHRESSSLCCSASI